MLEELFKSLFGGFTSIVETLREADFRGKITGTQERILVLKEEDEELFLFFFVKDREIGYITSCFLFEDLIK